VTTRANSLSVLFDDGFGSTAIYPVSCGNRPQWVDCGPFAKTGSNGEIAPSRSHPPNSDQSAGFDPIRASGSGVFCTHVSFHAKTKLSNKAVRPSAYIIANTVTIVA
jgi:hypothetical protein